MKSTYPQQRFYTYNHLWVCPHQENMIVGATHWLVSRKYHIAGVHNSEAGIVMDEGDKAGHFILATGTNVPFRLPFTGIILNNNPLLQTQPDLWRHDPYGLGWLFSMEPVDPDDIKLLLDAGQYKEMAALFVI